MDELYTALMNIKERPGLYIDEVTIEMLKTFMLGYIVCQYESSTTEYPDIFPGFQEYIQEKYDIQSTQSWDKIIRFYSSDEKDAIEQFYKHLKNFYQA